MISDSSDIEGVVLSYYLLEELRRTFFHHVYHIYKYPLYKDSVEK